MKNQLVTQDYIKTIASLSFNNGGSIVKLKAVSTKLAVSNAAVSDMVKKLVKDGLVINHAYKGIELTDEGWALGRRLIRHHRLWEVFLHKTLDVPWDEVHAEAEHLEHAASDALINRIDAYLGYPKVDPHGNPIPTIDGEFSLNANEVALFDGNKGQMYTVVRFESLDSAYLNYLSQKGFAIHVPIQIVERFEFDESLLVDISGQHIQLSAAIAKQVFVTKS
ncbi:MAG: metal-dependent transcriptional regulator [Candidatus Marinamargulisbacteria bacterium]